MLLAKGIRPITTSPRYIARLSSSMASSQPKEGESLTGKFKVLESDLASAISPDPNDSYAKVLATPRVIGFMEIVSARMLVPHLAPGQMSVGVRVDMMHTAATPVDEDVSVTATFLRKEGKLFVFDVVANDRGGEIGKARHERAIIEESRLMSGARKRMGERTKL
jgi:fluoroacetyl-CoA thioesterase